MWCLANNLRDQMNRKSRASQISLNLKHKSILKSSVASRNTTCQTVDVPVKNGPAVFLHTHTALLYLQSHGLMKALDYQHLDGQLYLMLVLNVMLSKKLYLWPGKKENHPCTIKKSITL